MPVCKAMIISVGGSPEPLLTTIRHHKPEYVSFFPSQGTCDAVTRVKDLLAAEGISVISEMTLANDENDLLDCYTKASEAIARVEARGYSTDEVIVDYTGATKNMSVAIVLAAIDKGYTFSYVGGEKRTKDGTGIVETGHEKICANVNPWDFLGIDERRQASRFFNTCQYKAAFEILKGLSERAQQRKPLYRRLAMLVDGYYQWDLFRHRQAIACFKNAQLEELTDDREEPVRRFAQATITLQAQLEAILKNSQQGTTPCEEIAHDLYANALRRIDEGKTDDAILRLYRLVEMLAQARLLEAHGINVSDVKPEQLPEAIRDEYIRRYAADDGKIRIGQHAAYILLNELGDPLGNIYIAQEKQFRAIQQARNLSYLAHGFASSKEDICARLKEFALSLGAVRPADAPAFPRLEL